MRGAQFEQQRRIEAMLIGRWRHLHRDDGAHFNAETFVKFVRMLNGDWIGEA
jgi:hypothetical protein